MMNSPDPGPCYDFHTGRYVRVVTRAARRDAYWTAPAWAVKDGYRPKTIPLLRDVDNAPADVCAQVAITLKRINDDFDAAFGGRGNQDAVDLMEWRRNAVIERERAAERPKPKPRSARPLVTHEELLQVLHYDPLTGIFVWIAPLGTHVKPGDVAGFVHPITGYVIIGLRGRTYLAQRLAVFYMTGEWPKGIVDHGDRDRSNNRWRNLKDTTPRENALNSGPSQYPPDPWRRSARRRIGAC